MHHVQRYSISIRNEKNKPLTPKLLDLHVVCYCLLFEKRKSDIVHCFVFIVFSVALSAGFGFRQGVLQCHVQMFGSWRHSWFSRPTGDEGDWNTHTFLNFKHAVNNVWENMSKAIRRLVWAEISYLLWFHKVKCRLGWTFDILKKRTYFILSPFSIFYYSLSIGSESNCSDAVEEGRQT